MSVLKFLFNVVQIFIFIDVANVGARLFDNQVLGTINAGGLREVQRHIETLTDENEKLKAEIAENADHIKRLDQISLYFRNEILNLKSEQKQSVDEILVPKRTLTKIEDGTNQGRADFTDKLEKISSQFLTEISDLKSKQKQSVSQIMKLRDMVKENKRKLNAALNECKTNTETQENKLAILQKEVESSKKVLMSRSEATFTLSVNLDQLIKGYWHPPFYVRMLEWKINIFRREGALRLFLHSLDKKATGCSIKERSEYRLLSHNPNAERIFHKHENIFDSSLVGWGTAEFIKWDKLINPANGYVHNNSINIDVLVKAYEPTGQCF